MKNPKCGPFLRVSEVLGGLRSRKEKTNTTPTISGQKIKQGLIFYEILIEILLFFEVLKNLTFFSLTNQKSWLYNANNEQISNYKSLFAVNL